MLGMEDIQNFEKLNSRPTDILIYKCGLDTLDSEPVLGRALANFLMHSKVIFTSLQVHLKLHVWTQILS